MPLSPLHSERGSTTYPGADYVGSSYDTLLQGISSDTIEILIIDICDVGPASVRQHEQRSWRMFGTRWKMRELAWRRTKISYEDGGSRSQYEVGLQTRRLQDECDRNIKEHPLTPHVQTSIHRETRDRSCCCKVDHAR
jgi:hypothetical protein